MSEREAAAKTRVETSVVLDAHDLIRALEDNVCRVIHGKRDVVRLAVVSLLARGHVLIEDVPGVGKTTLAHALARSLGLSFQRIQFTSDLLPSDIIGVSVYDQPERRFRFTPGPLFAHVVLADEINRATPKTQSALLEAMSEGWVSVDRDRHPLPRPFLVLATQNPLEHEGTFPLPESQLDRFLMSLEVGYPAREHERELLMGGGVEAVLDSLPPVLDEELLLELQQRAAMVRVAEKLVDYMLDIAEETRASSELTLGVSPRGLQGLYRAVQALAFCQGRDFAIPDDVQQLAPRVLGHRVVVRRGRDETSPRRILRRIVRRVAVPV
ncbi:MAG TPA: AAA family ATPase [Thermoanaerobaculia bacterium]|nr:AAA family ATPase [Thermoanaerobaculia bacterium]